MSDTATGIVRAPAAPVETAPKTEPLSRDQQRIVPQPGETTKALFTGYEEDSGHPYVAKFYGIEKVYKDAGNGVESDVALLNDHIKRQISSGEIENSLEAVDQYLHHLEEVTGVQDHERTTMKIPQLVAYVRYLATKKLIKARAHG